MKKEHVGILEMVTCAMLWSIAGIFMKFLPWNGFALAGLRSLIAGLTIAVYMRLKRVPLVIKGRTLLSGVLMVTVGLSLLSVMLPLIGMMNSVA